MNNGGSYMIVQEVEFIGYAYEIEPSPTPSPSGNSFECCGLNYEQLTTYGDANEIIHEADVDNSGKQISLLKYQGFDPNGILCLDLSLTDGWSESSMESAKLVYMETAETGSPFGTLTKNLVNGRDIFNYIDANGVCYEGNYADSPIVLNTMWSPSPSNQSWTPSPTPSAGFGPGDSTPTSSGNYGTPTSSDYYGTPTPTPIPNSTPSGMYGNPTPSSSMYGINTDTNIKYVCKFTNSDPNSI